MQEIIKAIIKARVKFNQIPKDRINPHYKSKYATLDAVLEAVRPGLDAAGLAIAQLVEKDDHGHPCLATYLMHESGEHLKSLFPLPELKYEKTIVTSDGSSSTREESSNDPQKLGSAITYARRYSICAILSVTADEDDDGNSLKTQQPNTGARSQNLTPSKQHLGCISEKQIARLMAISKQAGYTIDGLKMLVGQESFGYKSRAEIKTEHYEEICKQAEDPELAEYYNGLAENPNQDAA